MINNSFFWLLFISMFYIALLVINSYHTINTWLKKKRNFLNLYKMNKTWSRKEKKKDINSTSGIWLSLLKLSHLKHNCESFSKHENKRLKSFLIYIYSYPTCLSGSIILNPAQFQLQKKKHLQRLKNEHCS